MSQTIAICDCGATETIERRRLPTYYTPEDQNWITSCLTCYEQARDYYEERWADYYTGLL